MAGSGEEEGMNRREWRRGRNEPQGVEKRKE
jgi:hypothetical protein